MSKHNIPMLAIPRDWKPKNPAIDRRPTMSGAFVRAWLSGARENCGKILQERYAVGVPLDHEGPKRS